MTWAEWFFYLTELFGTAAFAISGAMTAVDKRTDLFGVILLGITTALGGGTMRDLLVGYTPPRMFSNYGYVLLATICSLAVFFLARLTKEHYLRRHKLIEDVNNVFDALGLGIFAVTGAQVGINAGHANNLFLCVFLGMMTGVGGGILRDLLLREIPAVLKKHVYAVAAIVGALLYSLLHLWGMGDAAAMASGILVTFAIRMLATIFRWDLPRALD